MAIHAGGAHGRWGRHALLAALITLVSAPAAPQEAGMDTGHFWYPYPRQAEKGSAIEHRLLVNSDGTNLFWRDDLSMEMVKRHVAELPNAVTTYLLCPNGIQKMMYPSAHEALATRGGLPALVEKGEDPFGACLAGIKRRGVETFVTFRMNEVHNVNNPEEPDLCALWREHPEYRVERGENPNNWMAQCLDYSLEPVRDHTLALLYELLEKYEPDGIELDWMRFPRHLSGNSDEVWEKRVHLTDVVARVREKANTLSAALKRPVRVAVRVPTSLAGCRALGADIAEWHRRKLVDFITVAPFLASDFWMPIEEMRQALGEAPPPIYAGIEFGYMGAPHCEETLRAAALGLYGAGADGIYVFNFPCWREHQPHPPWAWIPQLGDPDQMKGKRLAFPIIDGKHRVAGIDLPAPLPVQIPSSEARALTLRLPEAAFDAGHPPNGATLKLEPAEGLEATVNGAPLAELLGVLQPGNNEITLKNISSGPLSVTCVELTLDYPTLPRLRDDAKPVTTFFVSPDGLDGNPGTEEQPFETIARAQELVRAVKYQKPGDIEVILRGGVYRLKRTLTFRNADSGVNGHRILYKAFPGEEPVISGGKPVTGWAPDAEGRWKACAPSRDFRQLYVNGRRATRARGACPEGVERFGSMDHIDADAGHVFPDGAMAGWRNPGNIELGYYNSWSHMICAVDHITRDASGRALVHMKQPWFFLASRKEGVQATTPAYVENAFELLDEPGEWYADRNRGTLYYLPREGEDMATAEVVAPQLEVLMRIEGEPGMPAQMLAFEGITFADATWLRPNEIGHPDVQANFIIGNTNLYERDGALVNVHNEYLKSPANVVLRAAAGCRFERCTFTRLGGAGVDIEAGSQHNTISGCRFHDISGSAIQIGDVLAGDHHPKDASLIVKANTVANNYIHDVGVEYEDSIGVFVGYTENTVITHNEICALPYSGVSIGWGWGEEDAGAGGYPLPYKYESPTPASANRIEYNHVHHVMGKRNDGGGVYTLSNQPGTIIRGNHIHDNGPGVPGGVYLDEGSGFIEVTGNCVYNVATPMNYNNRVQNRIETCFEHDNFFDAAPDTEQFPREVAERAGLEPEYKDLK